MKFVGTIYDGYSPDVSLVFLRKGEEFREEREFLESINEELKFFGKSSGKERVVAHVCDNFACKEPTSDVHKFRTFL